jgi:AraC-like DNA-binding protein
VQQKSEAVIYRADLRNSSVPLGLRSVGQANLPVGFGTYPRKVHFVHVIWTISGQGELTCSGMSWTIKPDQVLVCRPGEGHAIKATGREPWNYRWFTLDGPLATLLVNDFNFPTAPFNAGPCDLNLFNELENNIQIKGLDGERIAGASAYTAISKLASRIASDSGDPVTKAAIQLAHTNIGINVQELADACNQSRFAIHRSFVETYGTTPKNYLDSMRLQKALALLKDSNYPIAKIAKNTGFTNANYFAKFFRKKTGMTPTQFRNQRFIL